MARTRSSYSNKAAGITHDVLIEMSVQDAPVEVPARGRGRGRARGRGRGRGRARGAAPGRAYDRGLSPEPPVEPRQHQAPPEAEDPATIQGTLREMMGLLQAMARGGIPQAPVRDEVPPPPAPAQQQSFGDFVVDQSDSVGQAPYIPPPISIDTPVQVGPSVAVIPEPVLAIDDQQSYERFQKMKPPQFQGGKGEDAYEFLTLSHELLEAIGLVNARGVRFIALQLRGTTRDWWRSYLRSRPVGSPPVEWGIFSEVFQARFIPWSVREESRSRFEAIAQGGMTVAEYEARFDQLSRHALSLIPTEAERVRRFVKGLTFPIRSYVFRAAREGMSFPTIVSTAKEAELLFREEYGDPKRVKSSGQFSGTTSGGRGFHRGSSSSQSRGPIHASLPASETGQGSRSSQG